MSLKKAELHVHLEGTITPSMAKKLALRNQIMLPGDLISADEQSYLSRDFLHFLKVYDNLAALIKCPQDYYDITMDYLQSRSQADAIYVEMMYSPEHAELSSGIPSIEHLIAIQQAIDDAKAQTGIIGRIIITAVRHFGVEAAEKVARKTHIDRLPCITGFGLGGDEAQFPPKLFTKTYQIASDSGLECTVHAGEFAPASGMIEAMTCLPVTRIGHGVNAIHSLEAMAMIKDKNITLELCPTSNIFLGLFKDMEEHPFPQFYDAGIKVSISSDDPPFMSTTLENEYHKVQQAYQYSSATMNHITQMSIEAAFLDFETKKELLAKI